MYEIRIWKSEATQVGIFRKETKEEWHEVYRQVMTEELDVAGVIAAVNLKREGE